MKLRKRDVNEFDRSTWLQFAAVLGLLILGVALKNCVLLGVWIIAAIMFTIAHPMDEDKA